MPKTLSTEPEPLGQLILLSPGLPVRTSPSLDAESDWLARVVTCRSDLLSLLANYGPSGCCSRTSLASLAPYRTLRRIRVHRQMIYSREKNGSLKTTTKLTKEVISASSWPLFQTSGIQVSPGQSWTLSTSAWRNGASVCSLSQVLETGPIPSRYYLTAKACQGILRRAEKRGKELPVALRLALMQVTQGSKEQADKMPSTDIPILSPKRPCASTLGGGVGRIDGESETFIGSFQNTGHGWRNESDCAQTVRTPDGGGSMEANVIGFYANDSGNDASAEIAPTLRSMGEGGGNHPAIAFDTTQVTSRTNRSNPQPGDPCHTLAKGAQPPAIAFRASGQDGFTPDSITPPLTESDGGGTVPTVAFHASHTMAVRRLTPLECERLQGFPDGFTAIPYKGKPAADSPRYKALGNSMAVPVIAHIGERIRAVEGLRK